MSENRLAWDQYFAAQALLIANRSTCKRAKVGAVLVKDNKVISTGYNGSVSGTEHCIDHECLVIDGHCVRTLHAEVNAILQGAERGVPKGFTAYVDGKETKLQRANTMFMALELEPGSHEIRLTYCTPYLKAGMLLSVLGLVIYVMLVFRKKK